MRTRVLHLQTAKVLGSNGDVNRPGRRRGPAGRRAAGVRSPARRRREVSEGADGPRSGSAGRWRARRLGALIAWASQGTHAERTWRPAARLHRRRGGSTVVEHLQPGASPRVPVRWIASGQRAAPPLVVRLWRQRGGGRRSAHIGSIRRLGAGARLDAGAWTDAGACLDCRRHARGARWSSFKRKRRELSLGSIRGRCSRGRGRRSACHLRCRGRHGELRPARRAAACAGGGAAGRGQVVAAADAAHGARFRRARRVRGGRCRGGANPARASSAGARAHRFEAARWRRLRRAARREGCRPRRCRSSS